MSVYSLDFEAVLQRGLSIEQAVFKKCAEKAVRSGRGLIEILLEDDIAAFNDIAEALRIHLDIVAFSQDLHIFTRDALELIPARLSKKHNAIPVYREPDRLFIAMPNPLDRRILQDFEEVSRMRAIPLFARGVDVGVYIGKYYGRDLFRDITDETRHFVAEATSSAAPAVKLADAIIEAAIASRASDVHIEPFSESVRIRFRIDGRLQIFDYMEHKWLNSLVSRLKIMGEMDISEKRLPQDGHFSREDSGEKIDFRLSTIAATYGEKVVIRLIYGHSTLPDLDSLGFFPEDIQRLESLFTIVRGAVLLCGPTGCGKTTTLSAILTMLNRDDVNIVTIEDPVENLINGANQIGVNPKAGLHFSNALRAILRQDPDIIMVGEIRDTETASLAIRSAITGHLMLSTLHTGDAVSAVPRLIDMGVEGYMVNAALRAVVSQRLVRRICRHCKKRADLSVGEAGLLDLPEDSVVYEGAGCHYCNFTGYEGRFAIYEMLVLDDEIKSLFASERQLGEIRSFLRSNGVETILSCGIRNILLGNTTVAEVCRAALE